MITYVPDARPSDAALNDLFTAVWPDHQPQAFGAVLDRSLAVVCAYEGDLLVGFVNVAWDGGEHAFILDTAVRRTHQRRGIGLGLVAEAVRVSRERG